jgi:hypothetical protein
MVNHQLDACPIVFLDVSLPGETVRAWDQTDSIEEATRTASPKKRNEQNHQTEKEQKHLEFHTNHDAYGSEAQPADRQANQNTKEPLPEARQGARPQEERQGHVNAGVLRWRQGLRQGESRPAR